MTQKIAVAIIHGVGAQNAKFAEPMSHNHYWTDNDVTKPIAKNLANTWKAINT